MEPAGYFAGPAGIPVQKTPTRTWTGAEVARHNTKDSCWVIIHGNVYDVTHFLPDHPGGQKSILQYAGRDATEQFDPIHPQDTLDKFLPSSCHLGPVDMGTVAKEDRDIDPEEEERRLRIAKMPPLSSVYNLFDFESIARRVMKKNAWAYYSSGADDEFTMRENHFAFHKIGLRPRILVDVRHVDISTTMLGVPTKSPFYITAAALGKLGNPQGEVCLTRAAGKHDVVQMIPTLASCSFDEIVNASNDRQTLWFQLYVNENRDICRGLVQRAERRGCKGLFITVDAPQLGRREKDMRVKYAAEVPNVQSTNSSGRDDGQVGGDIDRTQGAARAITSFIDPSLTWDDIPWFRSITKMPIVLKGVQRVDDVLRAVNAGVNGVVLSNHGGRQLEFAPTGIELLVEVMAELRRRKLQDKIEIYIDGGIRRGTDIIKALALGAKGVGLGRPFLYAMSAYGADGVSRAMALLKNELEMNMRLVGARTIHELTPDFVDARSAGMRTVNGPVDELSSAAYEPLLAPSDRKSKL